jgi:phosphoribosylformylglycinamidine (FGAM) synthase PurS component
VEVEAADEAAAKQMVDDACRKLLANMIMERYDLYITLHC